MKACKIITTTFLGRTIREKTSLCGVPKGLFNHSQNFPTPESVIDLLKLTIEFENKINPGVLLDTIIVNNDVGYRAGNDFLNSIDEQKTHSGIIKILHRENYGRSFGGYNHAFETFKDEYDYFSFTEDDILLNGDNYIKKAITTFESNEKNGAVAYQSTSIEGWEEGVTGNNVFHIHGGVCLSSAKVLKELYNKLGYLPHSTKNSSQAYEYIIKNGEIAFTNEIFKMGYNLINAEEKLYEYAYDYMRGIKI